MDFCTVPKWIISVLSMVIWPCFDAFAGSVHTYSGQFDLRIPADPEASKGWMHDAVVDVPDHLAVCDVDVRISLTHTKVFDLRIFVQSPAGTRICLITYNPFSEYFEGENYTQTVFDDEAQIPIDQGKPPFTGRFRPREPYRLAAFDGEDCFGPWRLQIYDAWDIDTGNLNSFELIITGIEPATLSLLQPNGGEVLTAGSAWTVSWASTGSVGAVLLDYSVDKGATWAAIGLSGTGQAGSYEWQIPAVDSNQCLVRISDANKPSTSDTSDGVFTICLPSVRPPTVMMLPVIDVGHTTATLQGLVVDDGGQPCRYRFSYWTDGYYCCTGWSDPCDAKTKGQSFGRREIGLAPGLYYFTAQAINSAGEGDWANPECFTIVRPFTGSGSGTEADPYIITSVQELQQVNNDLSAWYELGNDIDGSDTRTWLSGYGFTPIGRYTAPFEGVFDGKGHVISGLYINRDLTFCAGLFGCAEESEIRNVGLVDAAITGWTCTGGLVAINKAVIKACYVSGNVNGVAKVGGLVGLNSGLIQNCYSTASVSGGPEGVSIAGLAGQNSGGILENCYSTGPVDANNCGGLVARCGPDQSQCNHCFWDTQTSGQAISACGIGKTTAQMRTWLTFAEAGWDFLDTWVICEHASYPKLAWQIPAGDVLCPDGVDMVDFASFAARWRANHHEGFTDGGDSPDLDHSGTVDAADLRILTSSWLTAGR